jgi:hypothetical protein
MTLSAPSFLAASTSLSMPPRSAADFAVAAEPAGFSSLGGFDGEPQPVAAASNRVTPATDVMAVDRNLRTDVLLGWYGVARCCGWWVPGCHQVGSLTMTCLISVYSSSE